MISFKKIFRSFGYAFSGLVYVVKTQNNARFHLISTLLVIIVSLLLKLSLIEWCFIILAICLVWIAECFNTSIEKFFDLISPEFNPLVKRGKDAGAAAVLVAALLSISIGIIILGPHLVHQIIFIFS